MGQNDITLGTATWKMSISRNKREINVWAARLAMKLKQIAFALAGAIVALLGALWFLQGAAIIQVCPVLCFADCECVSGGSAFWEAAGAVAFIIGVAVVGANIRRAK
jgi:hypothetical protein